MLYMLGSMEVRVQEMVFGCDAVLPGTVDCLIVHWDGILHSAPEN